MMVDAKKLSVARSEYLLLAILLAVAAVLRCGWPQHMAIEHFDEGVYASDVWFGLGPNQSYPFRHLYAPPLVPLIDELSLLTMYMHPASPIWAGIAAGMLTIVSVWWLGRSWWGAAAGLLAATLAATSDVHASLSRTALTDPFLLLWLLWSLYFLERVLRAPTGANILGAGVFTGLAWWTKYNGWLPLAMSFTALMLLTLAGRLSRGEGLRRAGAWALAAAIALALFAPYLWSLQEVGGYTAVAANHRRYLVGWTGWLDSGLRNLANLRYLEGYASLLLGPTLVAAIMTRGSLHGETALASRPSERAARRARDAARLARSASAERAVPRRGAGLVCAILLAAGFLWLGVAVLLAVITALGLAELLYSQWRSRQQDDAAHLVAPALLAVWFGSLIVLTPLYFPYVRLTLPWLASGWLGAAWALARLSGAWWGSGGAGEQGSGGAGEPGSGGVGERVLAWLGVVGVVLLVAGCGWRWPQLQRAGVPSWEDRSGLRQATLDLVWAARREVERARVGRGAPQLVLTVWGEPAVFYHVHAHLHATGWPLCAPVASLTAFSREARALPTFLVVGHHANRDPHYRDRAAQRVAREGRLVAVQRFVPSSLSLLDHIDVRRAPADRPEWELRLYGAPR